MVTYISERHFRLLRGPISASNSFIFMSTSILRPLFCVTQPLHCYPFFVFFLIYWPLPLLLLKAVWNKIGNIISIVTIFLKKEIKNIFLFFQQSSTVIIDYHPPFDRSRIYQFFCSNKLHDKYNLKTQSKLVMLINFIHQKCFKNKN